MLKKGENLVSKLSKREFKIWYSGEGSVWHSGYRKYRDLRGSGKTPPEALRDLIAKMEQARQQGIEITL